MTDNPSPENVVPEVPVKGDGPGTVLGLYTLVEKLGEGGFGTVWLASQTVPIKREVALKILKPGMDSMEIIARFELERQALAVMDHPNIARVIDAGTTHAGRPYFVMQRVDGVPLTTYCDRHRLTIRQRLELFLPICQAVQHAHVKGIVHRDLKPSNILVAEQDGKPVPKVIDFGIAKAIDTRQFGDSIYTLIGQVIGTSNYMSPEQVSGRVDIDTRADIYSLGILLYELLVGITPMDPLTMNLAGCAEMERLICEVDPPRPSLRVSGANSVTASCRQSDTTQLSKTVRGDLDWIVMRALEKDRDRRYQTANDLSLDLGRYLNLEPVLAGPPSVLYRLGKFARRNKGSLSAAAALFLLLIGGTGVSLWQAQIARTEAERATRAEEVAESKQKEAELATTRAVELSEEIRRNLYVAEMGFAAEASARPDGLNVVADLTAKWQPGNGDPDLRGWEWYYLESQLHQELVTLRGHQGRVFAVSYSPDGSMIASGGVDRQIRLWDTANRTASRVLAGHTDKIQALAWSPDGGRIASVSRDKTLRIWDAAEGTEILQITNEVDYLSTVSWSPDGTKIGAGGAPNFARIWDSLTGRELKTFPGEPGPGKTDELRLHWRPQSDQVALSQGGHIRIVDAATGGEIVTALENYDWFKQWSPDGSLFAKSWSIWNVNEGKIKQKLEGYSSSSVNSISWSPDGKGLASGANDATIRLWRISSGKLLGLLRGHQKGVRSVSWSPRGTELASGGDDGLIKIWNLSPFLEAYDWIGSTSYSHKVSWKPDGKQVAVATTVPEAAVTVWNPAERRRIYKLPVPTGKSTLDCVWSSDGRMIAAHDGEDSLWIWDAGTGQLIDSRKAEPGSASGKHLPKIAWQPGGGLLAYGGRSDQVTVYDTGERKVVARIPVQRLNSLAWNPTSTRLAMIDSGRIRIWELQQGTFSEFRGSIVGTVSWSPDGRNLAVTDFQQGVRVLDANSGKIQRVLMGHNQRITCVAWSPDGSRIASGGGEDQTIRIWDPATGEPLCILHGHTEAVLSLAWSPDGTRLLSGGKDRMILWDATRAYEAEAHLRQAIR